MLEQAPGRSYGPWRVAYTGAVFLAEPHGGPTLEQSIPEELHLVERTHIGKVMKDCLLFAGPQAGGAEEHEEE